ncbi:GDSL-type esterase/lipase family protein [Streptomyces sp. NPDC052225]|uniref:GDSL-type esterase/lipase family protein n=1 Tax=Streptomyces sp. NPDC052225 TaxID=3154949 RepID=UPI00342236E9
MHTPRPHLLFSFGTLLDERVQATLFGGPVPSRPAALAGHTTTPLRITDATVIATSGLDVHLTLVRQHGAEVKGAALRLTDADLEAADAYEVDDYVRRRVRLTSGETTWAYLDARPLRPASRIVIVGDSIAYGRCDPRGGWAGRLAAAHIAENETGHRLFNLAIPGSTLTDVSEQTPALLGPRLPDTLLVAAGINDAALPGPRTRTDRQLTDALASLADTAMRHNARLVVAGPSWIDETRTPADDGLHFTRDRALALRATLRTWCADHDVDHLDLWEPLRDRPDLLTDGLHPTPEGHEALYRHIVTLAHQTSRRARC